MNETLTMDDVARAVDYGDPISWGGHCHDVSLRLVRSGILGEPGPECRVVRGAGIGIGGQHSWVVVGDPFDPVSKLIDPTAFGWRKADDLVVTTVGDPRYTAHGYDPRSIWEFGRPSPASPLSIDGWIEVTPPDGGWSEQAETFLGLLGPLNIDGWVELAQYPTGGWPFREICLAIIHDPGPIGRHARVALPIDVASLRGSWNVKELYW